jgi:hypothetical protein
MAKYIKLPLPVEAEQWNGGIHHLVCIQPIINCTSYCTSLVDATLVVPHIHTREGIMRAVLGSWIITGAEGEHWMIQDSIFKKTYEKIED